MSFPILLQGKLLGSDGFLASPVRGGGADEDLTLVGRARWAAMLCEVVPRALLAELGLAPVLLGSSGGGEFLLILPMEIRERAEEFLATAAAHVSEFGEQRLSLVWSWTEHLGDWSGMRKRLQDALSRKMATPGADFAPFQASESATPEFFARSLAARLPDTVYWSPGQPAAVDLQTGKHSWPLKDLNIPQAQPFSTRELAARARGLATWGVLRGNVDQFEIRLRRAQTDMEYLQLALSYRSFFTEELEILRARPEFREKTSILHCGGADFCVYGAWDALIAFAREVQRLFQRFAEANFKDLPGAEGKTVTMALALANVPEEDTLASVYQQAAVGLRNAKCTHKDSIHLLGRTLEWKHVADACDLKDNLVKLIEEHGVPSSAIRDLQGMYRDTQSAGGRARRQRLDRPWRYMRRINRLLEAAGKRRGDFQKLRRNAIADLVGGNQNNVKLRPSGRAALEWARLSTESS